MAQRRTDASRGKQRIAQGTQRAIDNPWFARLARFGYAAKGSVYVVAGVLSARAAVGLGGTTTDTSGALTQILAEPFGELLLALIGIGLFGYVLLRLVQALMDPEHKGRDVKGVAIRIGYAISAFVYVGLAVTALRLASGRGSSGSNQGSGWVTRLFALPFGRWLVGIVAVIIVIGGLYQLYKAYSVDFSEHFRWDQMSAPERTWTTWLGRAGLAARGIVQVVVGLFMFQAALRFDPSTVQGSNGALQSLARPPFGLWAVALVALGLAAYGVYMLAAARYSRIVTR